MQYLGFGNGSSGALAVSGSDATETPIDSSAVATSTTDSITATNASFAGGQIILVHQSRGTNVGNWELNFIESYTAGTITTEFPMINSYSNSSGNLAQVRVVPQYSSVTIDSGYTYYGKAWNGQTGGVLAFLVQGHVQNDGTINMTGRGYIGASGVAGPNYGKQGEGTAGARDSVSTASNGNGGGGGEGVDFFGGGGGGGGAHAFNGSGGGFGGTTGGGGNGGSSVGVADGTTLIFGGAGGSGGNYNTAVTSGTGGNGGGVIVIMAGSIDTSVGYIISDGSTGANGGAGNDSGGGGGGHLYLLTVSGVFGTDHVLARAGAGGSGTGSAGGGGTGSVGRITIVSCDHSGTTNPTATESKGGHDFCQSFIHIWDN